MAINQASQAPPLTFDINLRYDVDSASRFLRQSRVTTYKDIREGRLIPIKEGKRTFIPGSEIARRCRAPDSRP